MLTERPLRCALTALVKQTFRALLLRHGCTEDEAKSVTVSQGRENALAEVRCSDGRQLFRVYNLADLDRLVGSPNECGFLAREVSRVESVSV